MPLPADTQDAVACPAMTGLPDETLRVRVASNPTTSAQVLEALADDYSVTVRAAVATNPAATPDIDAALALDPDDRVRILLARKLAHLIPQTGRREREQYRDRALSTLAALVEDEAERVRAAIADVVKEMPQAPRELILRLAHDSAVPVSEPVIRLSPLLTPADLLELLARPSVNQAASAVAGAVARRPNLCEAVADAVAASADNAAVAALLSNQTAAIREATLDALIARAVQHEEWHDPLVRRPKLTGRAARALSEIVTTHLLEVLASRGDLEPDVTADLRCRLVKRLAPAIAAAGNRPIDLDDALAAARGLHSRGELDEQALLGAAAQGDSRMCIAILATAIGVAPEVVQRAATLRSAKGLVSLAWQAGFSMRAAAQMQVILGKLGPNAALRATPSGDFPLAADEMRWQVDLLKRLGR